MADLLAVVFIFTVVVVAEVQSPDQLFGQRAQRTHEGLAEYCIPSQLQLCVCTKGREREKYGEIEMTRNSWP